MTDTALVNAVHSTSTHVPGRAINSVGHHHFIIDGSTSPKEEITPVDAFLASIAACGVHLVERFAEEGGLPLRRVEADIEAGRNAATPERFDFVKLRFTLTGTSRDGAEELVERFKGR